MNKNDDFKHRKISVECRNETPDSIWGFDSFDWQDGDFKLKPLQQHKWLVTLGFRVDANFCDLG